MENMGILLNLLLSTLAVILASYLVPGVQVASFFQAVVVALALGVVNAVIKPILTILTLPLTILTLGLFSLIINGLMVMLVDALLPGFSVQGFFNAIIFSLILSILSTVFSLFK
jgi:putative membrane protein